MHNKYFRLCFPYFLSSFSLHIVRFYRLKKNTLLIQRRHKLALHYSHKVIMGRTHLTIMQIWTLIVDIVFYLPHFTCQNLKFYTKIAKLPFWLWKWRNVKSVGIYLDWMVDYPIFIFEVKIIRIPLLINLWLSWPAIKLSKKFTQLLNFKLLYQN